jgi:hypothetical protein
MRPALALLALLLAIAPAAAQPALHSAVIDSDVREAKLTVGDAEIKLGSVRDAEEADRLRPSVELFWQGRRVGRLTSREGDARFEAMAHVVEMDGGNGAPEVVLESYTGEVQCCTEVRVLSQTGRGTWAELDAGLFSGDPGRVEDADGDGRYEIVGEDDTFLYAFGCFVCSAAPLQILAVKNGEMRDVSLEPRYYERHQRHLAELEEDIRYGQSGNAFLAGWVAQKAILGEQGEAWAEMLLAYDRNDKWGLEVCRDGSDICAEADRAERTFPEALKDFLNELGYPL